MISLLFIILSFAIFATIPVCGAVPTQGRGDLDTTSLNLTKLQSFKSKPRIFVLSDILNEVDDSETLIRYLLYSNEFDTRGICAVTSIFLQNVTHPEAMRDIIRVYGSVVDNLNNHVSPSAQYQSAKELLALVTTGPAVYGKPALSLPISEGAQLLIDRLEESTEPLYVLIWGGPNTLAQALHKIQHTRSKHEASVLRSRLRVYSISDQDDTGEYIRHTFPDIFYISSIHGWRAFGVATWEGISQNLTGASYTKVSQPWLQQNIQLGPLGAQYPTPQFLMEGDGGSLLYMIQNGLGNTEFPDFGSWGGRYKQVNLGGTLYSDVLDTVVGVDGNLYTDQKSTIYRWRDAFQNDMAARIQWTLTSEFNNATHPPVLNINGTSGPESLKINATLGQTLYFDASQTYDPDNSDNNSKLEFQWYQYMELTSANPYVSTSLVGLQIKPLSPPKGTNGTISHNNAGFRNVALGPRVEVTLPTLNANTQGVPFHLILQVTNSASLPLTRYMRVVING